jgi:hypothetical protein
MKTTPHNHGPAFGQLFDDCPRCAELKAKPYVLTFQIEGEKKTRVPVASVREAMDKLKARLPAVAEGVPVVTTPGGGTVAILKVER